METHTTMEIVEIPVNPHNTKIVQNSKRTLRQRYDEYAASKARLKTYTEAYLALKYLSKTLYEGTRIPDAIFNAKREMRAYMREEQIQHAANKKVWKFMFHRHLKLF